jgi:alpha-ketoglutarate-dependent taurine dioxygenase
VERVLRLSAAQQERLASRLRDRPDAPGEAQLVAYVVPRAPGGVPASELRRYLTQRLPVAAVPSQIVFLAELPLLPSGKLDRRALPPPDGPGELGRDVPYHPPRTDTERLLVGIWEEVLGRADIGVYDDLFAAGGNSLLAAQIVARVGSARRVELSVADVFSDATVARLAARIDEQAPGAAGASAGRTAVPLVAFPRGRTHDVTLSSAELRHWLMHQLDPRQSALNVAAAVRVRGTLDVPALERALNQVISRHEVLRTGYPEVGGMPTRSVVDALSLGLHQADLRGLPPADRLPVARARIAGQVRQPFELATPPLLRAALVRIDDSEWVLGLVAHHIVADDWAFQVLFRELSAGYPAALAGDPDPLPRLPIQYADYAVWERRLLSGQLAAGLAHWQQQLAAAPADVTVPADPAKPASGPAGSAAYPFLVDERTVGSLVSRVTASGATLFTAALADYARTIGARAQQPEVVVGVPFANRVRPELEQLIGCFINPAALRVDLSGDPGAGLLRRLQRVVVAGHRFQHVPFERVVEMLRPQRDPTRPPLFGTVLNYLADPLTLSLPGTETSQFDIRELLSAKYDLTLYVERAPRGLECCLVYDTRRYRPQTVAAFADEFVASLRERAAAGQPAAGQGSAEQGRRTTMTEHESAQAAGPPAPRMRRRTVSIDPDRVVAREFADSQRQLPLILRPTVELDLVAWCRANRESLEDDLARYGAVLFRGFAVGSAAEFERVVMAFTDDLLNYVEGSSPRTMVADKVYTSTEYPPEYRISLHNELSYAHKWPGKLFFYCEVPAPAGGETPVADGRRVLELLPADLRSRFEERGVRYFRNLRGAGGPGLSWQTVFETSDRSWVEQYCREGGIEFEWTADGGLRTQQVRPGTVRHPRTGEPVWFNQADQWHPSNLGNELGEAMVSLADERELPLNAQYGDGSQFAPADLRQVREAVDGATVLVPWQAGDILMIDNTTVMHGRMPFRGSRRVLVSMGDTVHLADCPERPAVPGRRPA